MFFSDSVNLCQSLLNLSIFQVTVVANAAKFECTG